MVADYLRDIVEYMQLEEWTSYQEHLSSGETGHHIMESVLQLAEQVYGGRNCAACSDDSNVTLHRRAKVHLCKYCESELDDALKEFDEALDRQDEFVAE